MVIMGLLVIALFLLLMICMLPNAQNLLDNGIKHYFSKWEIKIKIIPSCKVSNHSIVV